MFSYIYALLIIVAGRKKQDFKNFFIIAIFYSDKTLI